LSANPGFTTDEPFLPACALLPSYSFQMLQTRLRARHPIVIIMTWHQRSLNHYVLPSCLHHLLVASSMPLFENHYSLACFWSAYDYSIAVATTIVPCLRAVLLCCWICPTITQNRTQINAVVVQQEKWTGWDLNPRPQPAFYLVLLATDKSSFKPHPVHI
jgi:hypothetical protein